MDRALPRPGVVFRCSAFVLIVAGALLHRMVGARAATDSVFTSVEAIRRLSSAEAARAHPVRLRATVTFFDRAAPRMLREDVPPDVHLFVQDETDGIFVYPTGLDPSLELVPGDRILLEGRTGAGDFAPVVTDARIVRRRDGDVPDAPLKSIGELIGGGYDSRWIRVRGVPQQAAVDEGVLTFRMAVGLGEIAVSIPGYDAVPDELVDSRVEVRGVCGTIFNDRRQLIGLYVVSPDSSFMRTLQHSSGPSFSLPLSPVHRLRSFDPTGSNNRRVRVRGVVTARPSPRELFLQDETGGLLVRTDRPIEVYLGDRVEAAGFPEPGSYRAYLRHGRVRRLGSAQMPSPVSVPDTDSLTGYHGRYVRVEAQLLDRTSLPEYELLTLRWHRRILKAYLFDPGDEEHARFELRAGSRLGLEGVLHVPADSSGVEPTGQRADLILNRRRPPVVLRAASWWTPRRAVLAVSTLALLLIGAVSWVHTLRSRVREQTSRIRVQMRREKELREEAQAAAEAKQQFLAGMSHDLRAPLSSVIGFTDLIDEHAQSDLIRRYAESIRSSGRKLLDLIDQVLTAARLGAEEVEIELEALDLADAVREQAALFRSRAIETGLELKTEADESVPVWADERAIERILRNLLSNAFKYTREGTVRVRAFLDRGRGVLEVADTGIGIRSGEQDRIFEAFAREAGSIGSEEEGVGLGLSIVKDLTDRLDAEIELESEPGEGTRFAVRIPSAPADAPRPACGRSAISAEETG